MRTHRRSRSRKLSPLYAMVRRQEARGWLEPGVPWLLLEALFLRATTYLADRQTTSVSGTRQSLLIAL